MATTASVDSRIQLISTGQSQGETCSGDLPSGPWEFDPQPGYGPGASMDDQIPDDAPKQGPLPQAYREADVGELHERIRTAKQQLGDRVVVLGHYYQRDEVVQHADFVGDSFQLANASLTRPDAAATVICGVPAPGATADLRARQEQAVILPNLAAGCSMADMADIDQVEECWEQLLDLYEEQGREPEGRQPVIPVTYMNSSAALKAFCGRNGGIVCT